MFVLILAVTLTGKQMVYAPMGESIKFTTYEMCKERAKSEIPRVAKLVKGEFLLACVPAETVGE